MLSLRSPQTLTSLALLLALLTATFQAVPNSLSESIPNSEGKLQSLTSTLVPVDCQRTLLKRSAGVTPPSGGFVRQNVARRAVGTVTDPGKICSPSSALKSKLKLRARSTPMRDLQPLSGLSFELPPAPPEMQFVDRRSPEPPHSDRPIETAHQTEAIPSSVSHAGEPEAAQKYARQRPW